MPKATYPNIVEHLFTVNNLSNKLLAKLNLSLSKSKPKLRKVMDAILATSANDVLYQKITYLGQDKPTENKIPWHSSHPIDLEFFKSFTAG